MAMTPSSPVIASAGVTRELLAAPSNGTTDVPLVPAEVSLVPPTAPLAVGGAVACAAEAGPAQ